MKKILFNAAAVLSATLILATGCIKETLPMGATQTATQVAKSEGALKAMVNAIPVSMMASYSIGYTDDHTDFGLGAVHVWLDFNLDMIATVGSNPYYNRFQSCQMFRNLGDQYQYCAYFWDAYYMWIKAANDIISIIDQENLTEETRGYLAMAYTYRAMCYLDLARLYEPKEPGVPYENYNIAPVKGLTVPIVTEDITEEKAKNNPRATHAEIYAFILNDLENAVKNFEGLTFDYTHPSLYAAYGLMARTYLEMGACGDEGAYAKAAEYAKKVIDESGNTPLTQAQWEDPKTGFNSGTTNKSWIWGLTLASENVHNLSTFISHMSNEAQYGYASYAHIACDKALYESISDNDWRKHSWMDPKRMAFYNYKFAAGDDGKWFLGHFDEDYISLKFRPAQGAVSDYKVGNAAEKPLMRIEEMYFIEAEALAMDGKLSEAKTVLEDLIKTRNSSYTCNAASTELFMNDLVLQKKIEFWGEGILPFDYKRLGLSITKGYEGTNHAEVYRYNTVGRSPALNLVITRVEYQSNTGITPELNNPDPSGKVKQWTENK